MHSKHLTEKLRRPILFQTTQHLHHCNSYKSESRTLFLKIYLFIYLLIYGCVGSQFLCEGFLQLWQAEATLHRSACASHYRGLSCGGAQAPDAQAQQLWLTGLVAPRHAGSSQTRARTRVPCIGRQILNHCTTREAPRTLNQGKQEAVIQVSGND